MHIRWHMYALSIHWHSTPLSIVHTHVYTLITGSSTHTTPSIIHLFAGYDNNHLTHIVLVFHQLKSTFFFFKKNNSSIFLLMTHHLHQMLLNNILQFNFRVFFLLYVPILFRVSLRLKPGGSFLSKFFFAFIKKDFQHLCRVLNWPLPNAQLSPQCRQQ